MVEYGLIGEKLGHSFSVKIHQCFGNDSYCLREIPREELDSFMKAADFEGLNVTIPYKQAVMDYCHMDEVCSRIGSVNTIVKEDDGLYAYNTDYLGFLYMTGRAGISFKGKKAVILGNGGTAKTAVYALQKEEAGEIILLSRRPEETRLGFPGCRVISYQDKDEFKDVEIIVNTTPVGMYPNNGASPVSLNDFPKAESVVDVVYNPMRTALLLQAEEKGLKYTDGLPMLVAQAWYAEALFFHKNMEPDDNDISDMEKTIEILRKSVSNICLVGMPGCGKSTVGSELAKRLGFAFIDTDEEFLRIHEMKAGDYITTYGEEAFRIKEAEVVAEVCKKTGVVIATGGGSILRKENRQAMHQNGIIVFLQRDMELLERSGRPLSASDEALKRLYEVRKPIYESMADLRIKVSEGNPYRAVEEIQRFF